MTPRAGADLQKTNGERRSGAETARKVLEVLLRFDRDHQTISVAEIAEELGVGLATAHRYVALLREFSLLEEGPRARYQLGWRVLALSEVGLASNSLAQRVHPAMVELAAATGETVALMRIDDTEMVCLDQAEGNGMVRLTMQPGEHQPLVAGASAKVLLAGLAKDPREALLDRLAGQMPEFASRRERFAEEVEAAAQNGWAESTGEITENIWVAAAPLVFRGTALAVLSIATLKDLVPEDRRAQAVQELRARSAQLSDEISQLS